MPKNIKEAGVLLKKSAILSLARALMKILSSGASITRRKLSFSLALVYSGEKKVDSDTDPLRAGDYDFNGPLESLYCRAERHFWGAVGK